MAFKKGEKRPEKAGRKKGTPNVLTKTFKEMVVSTLHEIQGHKYANLVAWAKRDPEKFYAIASKLIPSEVANTITIKKLGADLEEESYD